MAEPERKDGWTKMRRTIPLMLLVGLSLHPPAAAAAAAAGEDQFAPKDSLVVLTKANWALYDAIASSDVIRFACLSVERYISKCAAASDASEFKRDELREAINSDKDVASDLQTARKTLAKWTFSVEAKSAELEYVAGSFFLPVATVGGRFQSDWDKCQQADLYGKATEGVSVGLSSLVRWSRDIGGDTTSGRVELKGLSHDLKSRVDDEFGKSIHAVWRWTGLAKPIQLTSLPIMGRVSEDTRLIPKDLSLLLVDNGGTVLASWH